MGAKNYFKKVGVWELKQRFEQKKSSLNIEKNRSTTIQTRVQIHIKTDNLIITLIKSEMRIGI